MRSFRQVKQPVGKLRLGGREEVFFRLFQKDVAEMVAGISGGVFGDTFVFRLLILQALQVVQMHVQGDERLQAARRVGEVEFFSAFYSDLVCARRFFVVVRNAQVEHFELLCGGLACRFPVGHEVAYIVVCQLHFKPVGDDCHHVAFGGDIGHFGAGISPAVFPFELELSGLPAVGEVHAVGFVFDVCVRLDVAFQLVEAHQFVDECVFFLEEGRILCQLDAFFHPGAVACHFQHAAFPGALRPDDDIHFLEGDVCFVQRAYISYDEVFHVS